MRLTSYRVKAILVCLGVVILVLVVVAIRNGQASHDGWSWGLEFMAGLLANVVAALLFVLWFESESTRQWDKMLRDLGRRGSRVIPQRDRVARETYEQHYESSYELEIVGIACKPVLSGLFPDYDVKNATFALENCKGSTLYRRLTNGNPFKARIYFLNPRANYASERDREPDNDGTLADLQAIVRALEAITVAYANTSSEMRSGWRLTGTLSFRVFDCHPINSLFWAKNHDATRDVLFVGYLFYTVAGVCCPVVEFVPGIEGEVFNQCGNHLSAIRSQSKSLFIWDKDGPRMCKDALNDERQASRA